MSVLRKEHHVRKHPNILSACWRKTYLKIGYLLIYFFPLEEPNCPIYHALLGKQRPKEEGYIVIFRPFSLNGGLHYDITTDNMPMSIRVVTIAPTPARESTGRSSVIIEANNMLYPKTRTCPTLRPNQGPSTCKNIVCVNCCYVSYE